MRIVEPLSVQRASKFGVVSLVVLSVFDVPVSETPCKSRAELGVLGGVLSRLICVVSEVFVFPAISLRVTVSFEVDICPIPDPTTPVQTICPPNSDPQVIFGIVILAQVSTPVQVVVTV